MASRSTVRKRADYTNAVAAVYARYSDRGQNEASIEQQFEECDELAAQYGVKVKYRYSDKAMTGRNDKRPDFQRMMRDAAKGLFTVLLAWKSNRIGRNMMVIMENEERLKLFGVKIFYVKANFEDTAAGRFAARMMMNNDQYYSEALAEDVKRGMMYNAERCKSNGPLPDGYTSDKDGNIIIDEPRAAIIREIFQRVLDGESRQSVRRDLNARGIYNNRGKPWGVNAIDKIVTNERYRGIYTFAEIRIEGGMPRIISDEDFFAMQEYLRSKPNPRGRHRYTDDYLLTGKLFCGHCKAPMIGISGTSHMGDVHRYYGCTTRRRRGVRACAKKAVRKDVIEQMVAEYIREKILMDDEVIEWIADQIVDYAKNQAEQSELGLLRAELADVVHSLDNMLKAIEQGIITPTTKSRMEALEAEKAQLAAKVSAAEAAMLKVDRDELIISMRVMRKMDVTDKQAQDLLFDTFLQAVYLYDDHILITLNFTDGNPLDMPFNPDDYDGESESSSGAAGGSPKSRSGPPNQDTQTEHLGVLFVSILVRNRFLFIALQKINMFLCFTCTSLTKHAKSCTIYTEYISVICALLSMLIRRSRMRFHLTLKTLLRTPLKSAITLLLLTTTTFAFVSRGVEYVATVQQIRAAEAAYFTTGTVEMTLDAYENEMYSRLGDAIYELENGNYTARMSRAVLSMDSEVADLILSSEHIEKVETRLVSGGTHSEYSSVFEQPLTDLKDYNEWLDSHEDYGTLGMVSFLAIVENKNCGMMGPESSLRNIYVQDILVGDETIWRSGQEFAFTSGNFAGYDVDEFDIYAANGDFFAQSSEKGHLMLAAGNERLFGAGDTSYTQVVDFPLVDLTRLKDEYGETDIEKMLRNPDEYDLIPFKRTDGQEVVSVLDYYTTVDRNLHTSEVVYTSDMDLIHKFKSGDMFISDGRALAENEQSEICVIGADFAELNGLSVGDSITLDLCADTMVHSGKVFGRETPYPTDRDVVSENQLTERGLPNVTKTFEIVGIWSDANFDVEDPYTYALNTIFVPESCYPWAGQVEPSLLPSTFSFELKHPGDAALIKEELGDQLAALGYELKINDGGYAAAKPNLDFMRLSALIGFVAMCVGLVLCLVLITYLFIIRKKKDYAIMRALGTTKYRSNKALLSALLVLSLCSVAIGGTVGGVVAQETAIQVAAEVEEVTGVAAEVSNSWTLVGAFAFGTVTLVLVFALFGLVKISRAPPLALLQGK